MSEYPSSLPLDRLVIRARLKRRKMLLLASRRGIYLRLWIIAIELLGFLIWHSSALLLDLLSCLLDVGGSLAIMWCIRKADQPPDRDHPLGHGRFEPIAGLLVGFSFIILGGVGGFEQIKALALGVDRAVFAPIAWVVPLCAIVLFEWGYAYVKKIALAKESSALLADATHYRIDAFTSLFALIALGLTALFPHWGNLFDRMGAIAIACFMIVVGLFATRKNIHQLLDRSPDKSFFKKVRSAALSIQGVLATEKCHIQMYGPDAHVAIDIEVDPDLSVVLSHEITQKVRRAIQRDLPTVRDVIVHVEPYYPNDHEN